MARASEGISANLRNETFAHLQRLSLDFFGGRRTGDLISRISSDTDRICSFLSDNVVDFGTDLLMIVGTSLVLVIDRPRAGGGHARAFPAGRVARVSRA